MPSKHMRRMRAKKRHAAAHTKKHKPGGAHKGMAGRHRQRHAKKHLHKTRHNRAGRKSHKAGRGTGKGHGAKAGRRMDHFHMRRRYLHAGLAGGAIGAGMLGGDDDMIEDSPLFDDLMLGDMDYSEIQDGGTETVTQESESESESKSGSESEDNASQSGKDILGPPVLESDEHCHVFIYHSSAAEDVDQMEHYMNILESSPNDLKVMSSERDFKAELSTIQNLMIALPLSLRTVLLCTQEFLESDLKNFESAVTNVMSEEERKQKVIVLLGPRVQIPLSLQKQQKILSLNDTDCFEKLTKILLSGGLGKESSSRGAEPSAPTPCSEPSPKEGPPPPENIKEKTVYGNGQVIKQVTACTYKSLEKPIDEEGVLGTYCPHSDMLCPRREPEYLVPESLRERGLEVSPIEFDEILRSLTEAAQVTFFRKAVDCSIPCLYLSAVLVSAMVSCCLWFLIAGALNHHREDEDISGSIFWSFMICIVFIPATIALVMLGVVLHLVNYKYLKYRIRVEELNKKFRETNLVLHVRKGYWSCSGRLKLIFIYYNFEPCQQTLYCHVHDNMNTTVQSLGESDNTNGYAATIRLEKIMKRVNTLTKKFEWEYLEALTKNKLPATEEKLHRKKGMCFCQYIIQRQHEGDPGSVFERVKDRLTSFRANALGKSHRRRDNRFLYSAPLLNKNGHATFKPQPSSLTVM